MSVEDCLRPVLCMRVDVLLFFFKQKTAYEMSISDWSSYVCSSDLPGRIKPDDQQGEDIGYAQPGHILHRRRDEDEQNGKQNQKIGRASCRERVCQYV